MSKKIAIIAGAGPAGLTAAYELLKRTDVMPIIFEATDAIGGIAQTFNYKGNRIDIGGHRFFSKSKRVMDFWFTILPLQGSPAADTVEKGHEIDYATEPAPDPEKDDNVMLQRPRKSRIYFRRNFFPYPIGITLTIAWRLGLFNTVLIALSYMKAHLFPINDETYLDAFMINRFGKRLYKTFFEDYTQKVWGVPCHQIKADWGAQRIKGLSLKRAVAHAIKDILSSDFSKVQTERETSLITRFYYPKFGPGQMWEEVANHVRKSGGEIHMRHVVVGIRRDGNKIVSVKVKDMETGMITQIACDYFFSTMPIKHLIAGCDPPAPANVSEVANGLIYRDFLTVGLLLTKLNVQEKPSSPFGLRSRASGIHTDVPDNWIYVQDRGVKVGRIQIFNNWSPYMVADRKNTVWIGLEYFVNEGDELWAMSDEHMIALGIKEMEQIEFIAKEDVVDACVLRMPKAYPAYFGTYDRLEEIRDWTLSIPNLFLIGRNGMHRYNNQDHSMLTAMTAVDNIVAGRTDHRNLWEVNAERTYHESKTSDEHSVDEE